MAEKKLSLYVINVLLFMLIIPILSIGIDCMNHSAPLSWLLIGKWFVFWGIGVRLLTAGIRQVAKPQFTAQDIFHFSGSESFPVIRELGFANICMGLVGVISICKVEWCQLAAIGGGLYFGLAGFMHITKKPASFNEAVALVSDIFIFLIALLYILFTVLI